MEIRIVSGSRDLRWASGIPAWGEVAEKDLGERIGLFFSRLHALLVGFLLSMNSNGQLGQRQVAIVSYAYDSVSDRKVEGAQGAPSIQKFGNRDIPAIGLVGEQFHGLQESGMRLKRV